MGLSGDDRGQSVQIGVIVLFGFLVVAMAGYQAQVVPAENRDVEINHNEVVRHQFTELRNAVLEVAGTGSGGPVALDLGVRYPGRTFFVNPPPASGRLTTVRTATPVVSIDNAAAVGQNGGYWTGAERNFTTAALTYDPQYRLYRTAPTTVFEHGLVYNDFGDVNRSATSQVLVQGRDLTVLTLTGNVSEAGVRSVTLDPRSVSAPYREVTVENAGGNITLTLPSTLPVERWRESLADQTRVVAVTAVAGREAVHVELAPGTYDLRMARVGLGDDVSDPPAHYAVPAAGNDMSVAESSGENLVVEVRDRYNNPVSGVTLNATLVDDPPRLSGNHRIESQGQSGLLLRGLTTDESGRVTIDYDLDAFDGTNADVAVRVSMAELPSGGGDGFDDTSLSNVTFELRAVNTDGSTGVTSPTAAFAYTPTDPEVGQLVRFNASASTDDSAISTYEWDWDGDGTYERTTTDPITEHRFDAVGTAAVRLRVTDDVGATDTLMRTVEVRDDAGNAAPVVFDFDVTPQGNQFEVAWNVSDAEGFNPGNVTVTVTDSGGATVYEASFTPDSNPYADSTTTGTLSRGTYTVTLTVRDGDGNQVQEQRTVTR